MDVKLKPVGEIVVGLGLEQGGKIHRYFQKRCRDYMDKYVPKDNGDLRLEVDLSDPNYIIYEMPYARYQYYGVREDGTHKVNPENYTIPGTGPYWDQKMWSAEKSDLLKELQDLLDRGG